MLSGPVKKERFVIGIHSLRVGLFSAVLLAFQPVWGQLSTDDHLADPGFWPRQSHSSNEAYAGDQACGKCHTSMVASQEMSRMAHAAMPAAVADLLHSKPDLSFRSNQYEYRIQTDSKGGEVRSTYSVTNGTQARSYPLTWAFGAGRVGQSYLFKKEDGDFYEARVTFYPKLAKLEFTPARVLLNPTDLEEAMYRRVPNSEVLRCFSCHTTGSVLNNSFDEAHLVPGIKCEACHGPGQEHVTAMGAAHSEKGGTHIYNPQHLAPTDSIEFCGACHGSWWDVKLSKVTGPSTTRSAPYRLATSKCWGKGDDSRLKCTGCHNPHKPLETRSEAYDAVCLQCHAKKNATDSRPTANQQHPGDAPNLRAACRVGTEKCTSCHMPKTYVSDMHDDFTDHRIRIVKAGEVFPE
jgi:hypothetical protein